MLKIRAHHLLCIPRYYHGGYNKKFAKQHKKVCLLIRKNPDLKIKILKEVDDLCLKCPHRKGKSCCKSSLENNKDVIDTDKRVFKKLKLKNNSIHIAKDVFNLSMDKITVKTLKKICSPCNMLESCLKSNINNKFKKELNK